MATYHNVMFWPMKGTHVTINKGFGSQECSIEATMCLTVTFCIGHLTGIQIAKNIGCFLGAAEGNQDHLVAMCDKGLGFRVFVIEKVNILGVVPAFSRFCGITLWVMRHDFQALGVRDLFTEQVVLGVIKTTGLDQTCQLLTQHITDGAS